MLASLDIIRHRGRYYGNLHFAGAVWIVSRPDGRTDFDGAADVLIRACAALPPGCQSIGQVSWPSRFPLDWVDVLMLVGAGALLVYFVLHLDEALS